MKLWEKNIPGKGYSMCKGSGVETHRVHSEKHMEPWLGSTTGWSILPICHGCGFDAGSGHMQESTDEYINK